MPCSLPWEFRRSIAASESRLIGTIAASDTPDLTANASTREALWDKNPTRSRPAAKLIERWRRSPDFAPKRPPFAMGGCTSARSPATARTGTLCRSRWWSGGLHLVNREVAYARSSTASSPARDRERLTTARRTWWQCDRLLGGMCQGRSRPSGGRPARPEATT
jgi:hypothetical protein